MDGNSRTAKSDGNLPYRCGCLAALMVVLGLIAGLGVIYFYPHLVGRPPGGRRTMAIAISNAVELFHADYNKLPVPVNGSAVNGDIDTDTSPENRLVTVLAGREGPVTDPQNPKNVDYLEGIRPAKANRKDSPPWKDGLMWDATSKALGYRRSLGPLLPDPAGQRWQQGTCHSQSRPGRRMRRRI